MGRFKGKSEGRGLLMRLARDVRGNTLALMAMAFIPFAGMIGGGMDVARLYLVKTRLQHACDAGALAGRKAMGGGLWTQANYMPRTVASRFFTANFPGNAYGSTNLTTNFTEAGGKVTGTASADLSMLLTRVIGIQTKQVAVTCEAEMRLPNTDVMFVLDNTGSMGQKAVSTDVQTKIEALRSAVKCFYEAVQKLDTDEVCVTGAPSGGLSDQVQVRFGFVPYAANVNVGRLLPPEYLANRWTYQSREIAPDPIYGKFSSWDSANQTTNAGSWGGWTSSDTKNIGNNGTCDANTFPTPADTFTPTLAARLWPVNGSYDGSTWKAYTPAVQRNYGTSLSGRTCTLRYRERSLFKMAWHTLAIAGTTDAVAFPIWVYRPVSFDISALKTAPNMASVNLPIGTFGAATSVSWGGCIEERQTVRATSYDPIPAGANDLDLESAPTGDVSTQWAPLLGGAVFGRKDANGTYTTSEIYTFNDGFTRTAACPAAAQKLSVWPDPVDFDNYVDSLTPGGNTYHDIGLIWGARLMWPTGIFRSENEFTPRGGEIQRHLIFMTDGDACTDLANYQAYGFAAIDRRQTPANVLPTAGCTTTGTLTQQVNARYQAVCKQVRNENITLWVIWFGAANNTIETMMRNCATPDRYFAARDAASLQRTFAQIADTISQLRVTQ